MKQILLQEMEAKWMHSIVERVWVSWSCEWSAKEDFYISTSSEMLCLPSSSFASRALLHLSPLAQYPTAAAKQYSILNLACTGQLTFTSFQSFFKLLVFQGTIVTFFDKNVLLSSLDFVMIMVKMVQWFSLHFCWPETSFSWIYFNKAMRQSIGLCAVTV